MTDDASFRFRIPAAFARAVSRLPQFPHSFVAATLIDVLIRRALDAESVHALEGKVLRLVVRDGGIRVSLACRNGYFHPAPDGAAADVSIAADLGDLARLALRAEDPDTLFFARRLTIEGDTQAGLIIKNMLDALEPETLFPWAQRLVRACRRAAASAN